MPLKSAQQIRREEIKAELWPEEIAWTGDKPETGWFRAVRTLPLILNLLTQKKLTENLDCTRVYVELLARHRDSGIVEMANPAEHAYGSGYFGSRAVRTWQERMNKLHDLDFIKSKQTGQLHKYVLLVHPTITVYQLQEAGKLTKEWWETYRTRQIEATEVPYEKLMERHGKVKPGRKAKEADKAA